PGCLRLFFGFIAVAEDAGGRGPRWLSASTSAALTPGSSSSNCNCLSLSFSLLGPYFWIRYNRRRSSSARIFKLAHCSSFSNWTIFWASEGGGVEGDGLTISSLTG